MKDIFDNNTIKETETELDLKSIFLIFWERKFLVIGIVSIFFIASVISALQIPNEYKATVILTPTNSQSGSLSQSMNSQVGGLAASLVGFNVGMQDVSEAEIALQIVQSWGFLGKFIQENNLEVELMASEGWNAKTKNLIINQGIYDSKNSRWASESSQGEAIKPSSWKLFEAFSNRFDVSYVRNSAMITLSFEFFSPYKAKEWVDLLVVSVNEYMRARKIKQVKKNISYLQSQAQKTSISEMKTVFFNIIEEQTKTLMLAEANADYAFIVVNKTMVPEEKSRPFRSLIVLQYTAMGGIFAIFLVMILRVFSHSNN